MNPQLTKLQELTAELHEVNRQFSEAARPLEHVLNEEEKDTVRAQLLESLARWESVSAQIRRVFEEMDARAGVNSASPSDAQHRT
jgi:predicted  nucleic acid-binding Zn-ribbon protein